MSSVSDGSRAAPASASITSTRCVPSSRRPSSRPTPSSTFRRSRRVSGPRACSPSLTSRATRSSSCQPACSPTATATAPSRSRALLEAPLHGGRTRLPRVVGHLLPGGGGCALVDLPLLPPADVGRLQPVGTAQLALRARDRLLPPLLLARAARVLRALPAAFLVPPSSPALARRSSWRRVVWQVVFPYIVRHGWLGFVISS